jgi:RND family efflux transporter MFP subunit
MTIKKNILIFFALLLCLCSHLYGAEGRQMPPSKVEIAQVTSGTVAPEIEFVGTVYYQEVSDLASEVSGKVEEVNIEEGQRVKKGQVLVRLDDEMLRKRLQAQKASYEEIFSDIEEARRELTRQEELFKKGFASEKDYDEVRFSLEGLIKKAASAQAEFERIEVELDKKLVRAPFNGIVMNKTVDRGEWLSEGAVVATIGKDDIVDVTVNVPEQIIPFIFPGMSVQINVGMQQAEGKILAIIPKGDIATRTFPVKVRAPNKHSFIEGMEARVHLPSDKAKKTLLVPRDAVINLQGETVLFAVQDSTVKKLPVKIIGYKGMMAGVDVPQLREGMDVVIKGNERLRDGQAVSY